jgi:hypothetical protein
MSEKKESLLSKLKSMPPAAARDAKPPVVVNRNAPSQMVGVSAGLIPFLGLPLLAVSIPALSGWSDKALGLYAAVILSFLGGLWWMAALLSDLRDPIPYVVAVLPSLIGWGAMLWPAGGLWLVALCLLASPLVDISLSRRIALPRDDPYFQRLLREHRGGIPRVQVLPHGSAPTPQAALGLRALLAQVLGPGLQLTVVAPTPYGDEEAAERIAAEPGVTLRLALVDLGATPEEDTHGRFLQALRAAVPGVPLLLLADTSAFDRRFAGMPGRQAERCLAWQQLAEAQGVGWVAVALEAPDTTAAEAAIEAALSR